MSDSKKKAGEVKVGRSPTETEFMAIEHRRLESKSREDLIDIIIGLKIKNRNMTRATSRVDLIDETGSFNSLAFGTKIDSSVETFRRLPDDPKSDKKDTEEKTWRFKLLSNNPNHKPLGLEIYDDVIVGRTLAGSSPDLDLEEYGAEEKGVSRQHAVLRPSKSSLYLIDLYSTNGTFVNGSKLSPSVAQKLASKDIISFGRLHFVVRILLPPGKADV